jgi:hypothetical protein
MEKGLTTATAITAALDRVEARVTPPWSYPQGPVLSVTFAASGDRAVAHRLGAVPDGLLIYMQTGPVLATRQGEWTDTVAYLDADAGTVATLQFIRLRATPETA